MPYVRAEILGEPLEVSDLIADAAAPACGAIASFIGTVRESAAVSGNADKTVTGLAYDAHPTLAASRLGEIATEAADKWELERIVAVHRSGECPLGEPTVVIVCASAHRAAALEACHWVIDEVKATVPIWKKEIYSDGSSWVGAENT